MNQVLAVIPARSGSKGIPGKNLAVCAGKPLLAWTFEAVMESQLITEAVLSSDGKDIFDLGVRYRSFDWRIQIRPRPEAIAQDSTPTEPVIADVLAYTRFEPDYIVLLQPTSPIRTGKQIDEAIEYLIDGKYDSVLSVVPDHSFYWTQTDTSIVASYPPAMRPRRQQLVGKQYVENGSIYVTTADCWRNYGNRLGGHIGLYVMPEECRFEVDTPFDLWLCGQILTWKSQAVK